MAPRKTRSDIPNWLRKACQGVTYWVGHRRQLYSDYPLTEGALVGELCNLISAKLKSGHLRCEVAFTEILGDSEASSILTERARADLVVEDDAGKIVAIVEVKRASAGTAAIENDLKRLAAFKDVQSHARAFLVVISEAKRPKKFVTKTGMAVRGAKPVPNTNREYTVRRVLKAAQAFSKREKAQYACVIEVT